MSKTAARMTIRALLDQIDAEAAAREAAEAAEAAALEARIDRKLVLWHHLREEALKAQDEAFYHRRHKWAMVELGIMPGELKREPDWNGHKEEAAWRRRSSLYEQSWVLAAQLHDDGVRDPTNGCNCDGCNAWGADHARAFAQEDWAYRPPRRLAETSAAEMRQLAALVAALAEKNRQDPDKTWERRHALWLRR